MASARSLDAALQTGAQVIAQAKRVQEMLRGSPTPAPQGQDTRFVPPPIAIPAADRESDETWGFADTRFEVNDRSEVVLTGSRYAVCGDTLPNLLPWIRDVMQVSLPPEDVNLSHFPPAVPAPAPEPELAAVATGGSLDALFGAAPDANDDAMGRALATAVAVEDAALIRGRSTQQATTEDTS